MWRSVRGPVYLGVGSISDSLSLCAARDFLNAGAAGARTPHARTRTHLHIEKAQEGGGPGHPDAAVQSGAAKPWIAGAAPAAALSVNGTWT